MHPLILVPYDFSPAAEKALRWAGDLNQSVSGGSIKILHVLPLPIFNAPGEMPLPPPSEEDRARVAAELHALAQRFAPGAAVEVMISANIPAAVLQAAAAWPTDLIVMGTHGRGGIKRLVLGSVADHIVRHAECPVVTLR
jgi:nucleotide-binding universal stress UspA family protein